MADRYVWNAAVGSGTGATWVNAHTNMTAAITASTAGDRFFVAHDHVENLGAATTYTFKGTTATPDRIVCANRAGSVPPVSADLRATAAISTTGNFSLTITGVIYCYGIIFSAGSSTSGPSFTIGAANNKLVFEACSLRLGGTGASILNLGPTSGNVEFVLLNTTFQFAAVGHLIALRAADLKWRNTPAAISGATIPTTLFSPSVSKSAALIEGVDLSASGAGKNLVGTIAQGAAIVFKDCKLHASVAIVLATPTVPIGSVNLIRCDSGDTNYRQERYAYEGTLTTETTIVRTGGASDGTTSISWKIVTNADAEWTSPFECFPISVWNETVGSAITLTVECIASAVLNNDDVWMDVEYLGTAGFPLGNFATSGKANILAANAANAASTETWGGGLSGKFKLVATVTPQEKGPITLYVKVAKTVTTVYVDPKVTVS